jgi:leucyl aminopeptidase (aminopeptidase T)
MEVEEGKVKSIEGGGESRLIKSMWESYDSPSIYNVAQLAVGVNPAVQRFSDRYPDCHGRWGNVHLGIGHSSGFLAGEVNSPIHFDAMMANATLELDGETILENGSQFKIF